MNIPAVISVALLGSLVSGAVPAQTPAPAWFSVARSILCVTEGQIKTAEDGRLAVDAPKMRAYVNRWTAQGIEARFTYLGPTSVQSSLASGAMRSQFGLKLRAQDGCNLVYAVWRFEPESSLVVSVKSNPTEHASADCGNHGYQNIKAEKASPVPVVHPGETHILRAEMNGADLTVFADDNLVWEGDLGPDVLTLNGPVGVRSDNARLALDLRAKESAGAHPNYVVACKSGGEDSD
jgi:hypothetical protein